MEPPVLSDKTQYPTEEVIYSHIGKSKALWLSLFEFIRANHSDFSEQWKYYNDGKSWLLKVSRKAKTIFWLSVINNSPRRQNSVGFCKLTSHLSWRIGYPLSAAAVMSCFNAGMRTICRSFVLSDAVSGLAPVRLATAGL